MTYGDLTPGTKIKDPHHGVLTFGRRGLSSTGEALYFFRFAEGIQLYAYLDMEVTPA